jgi:hypothetical protein
MKLTDLRPGEYRYAVVVREGPDLLMIMWIGRDPKGDVYVMVVAVKDIPCQLSP